VRPTGAAEDTALSNRVARGGGQRPLPDSQRRLACPIPAGPRNKSDGAVGSITIAENGPKPTFTPIQNGVLNPTEADIECISAN